MELLIPACTVFVAMIGAVLVISLVRAASQSAKLNETLKRIEHDRMKYDATNDQYTVPAVTTQSGHW